MLNIERRSNYRRNVMEIGGGEKRREEERSGEGGGREMEEGKWTRMDGQEEREGERCSSVCGPQKVRKKQLKKKLASKGAVCACPLFVLVSCFIVTVVCTHPHLSISPSLACSSFACWLAGLRSRCSRSCSSGLWLGSPHSLVDCPSSSLSSVLCF